MIMIQYKLQNYIQFSICLLLCIELNAGASDEVFAIEDCKKINLYRKCQCVRLIDGRFNIHCPGPIDITNPPIDNTNELFNVSISNQRVVISCNRTNVNVYDYLPQLFIGDINEVWLRYCPFLEQKPILDMFTIWRISNVVYLSGLGTGNIIRRKELYGLPSELEKISLQHYNISKLSANIFSNFKNLIYLNLKYNKITQMDPNTFSPLINLVELYLTKNNLSLLPIDGFANNTQLKRLVLSSNYIKYLQPGVFRNQNRLEYLDLQNNQLRSLQNEALLGANEIIIINLNGNGIENIEAETFSPLKNLEKLYLDGNNLSELPNLSYNTKLKVLSFSDNHVPIKSLPANIFRNQSHLQSLSLSCNLESLDENIFLNVKFLRHINLSHNALSDVPAKLLTDMDLLETLDLSYNYLQMLPKQFFSYWIKNNLKELKLSHNKLTDIPIFGFGRLSKRKIDLSYNNITILNHNHINDLATISKDVRLSHNQIREVNFESADSFLYVNDKSIDIDLNNNPLNCNCKLLNFVSYIQSIKNTRKIIGPEYKGVFNFIIDDLRCEEPENLKGRHANSLMPLELLCLLNSTQAAKLLGYSSKCRYIERTYDSVLIVNCSNGNMTKLMQLPVIEQLKLHSIELHINNNKLTELPTDSMLGFQNVTQVHASGNNLNKIELHNLPSNLSHLDLRHNNFTYLNEDVLAYLNQSRTLKSLSLSGNPWRCDCGSKLILQFIKDKQKQISDLQEIRCANPKIALKLFELSVTDICPPSKVYIYVLIGTTIGGSLIGITSLLYNKYKKQLKIWMYSHKTFQRFVNEAELDKNKTYDAFISYSHCDEKFIADHLAPQLEQGPIKFKLCIHVRDWIVGSTIPNNIIRSINESRRSIFILTNNFVKSTWSRLEFQVAHQASLEEKRSRIIIILFNDISNIEGLDEELAAYLKVNTYLEWGDPWFWDKLRYAMPHRSNKEVPHNHLNDNGFELKTSR